jgi:hypothetical protein
VQLERRRTEWRIQQCCPAPRPAARGPCGSVALRLTSLSPPCPFPPPPLLRSRLSTVGAVLAAAASLPSSSLADQQSLDCPLRQVGLDYAMTLQPFRPLAAFQEVADALNGAIEAQNCSVAPNAAFLAAQGPSPMLAGGASSSSPSLRASSSRAVETGVSSPHLSTYGHVVPVALPPAGALAVYADPKPSGPGCDKKGDGSAARPYRTLERALAHVRAARAAAGIESARSAPRAHIVLREGTFYRGGSSSSSAALTLTPEDSMVTFQAYPGESVFISGGTPIAGNTWATATPPARSVWEYKAGTLASGFDAAPAGLYTVAQAQALCASLPTCAAFVVSSSDPNPSAPVQVSFKYEVFWSTGSGSGVYVRNTGYLPGAANLYVTDLSSGPIEGDIEALRVGGVRMIRARYPNAKTVEQMDAMQLEADGWTSQPSWMPPTADYTYNPPTPLRNDSSDGYFQTFKLGVGGYCAMRFTPQAAYWCANNTQGGGPGPYEAPIGVTASTSNTSLPHTPYANDVTRALVHSWRAGRWFSWIFAVNGSSYDSATGKTVFTFSLEQGGNQGSRGGNAGQEFFIENVLDELDAPAEWYYDLPNKKLYLWYNATGGTAPPTDGTVVVPTAQVLINATGTQANPVVGVGFLGLGFRDSAPYYLGARGTPSGGDWSVGRYGALFFEGTVGTTVEGCFLTSLDGNAVFFSGYNRNATVVQNEFLGIGETAISQWGYTDGSPVAGLGFDATAGNQPRGTQVVGNFVHEVGLFTKQNSFYFQSESFGNLIMNNIAFNGPRAGELGMGGDGGGGARAASTPWGRGIVESPLHACFLRATSLALCAGFDVRCGSGSDKGSHFGSPSPLPPSPIPAGINFDDGLGGGSHITQNVLFNFCRESSDHGPFNCEWAAFVGRFGCKRKPDVSPQSPFPPPLPPRAAWDRQVYIYDADGQGGQPTIYKRNDTIDHNWILANYHSSMAIDNGTWGVLLRGSERVTEEGAPDPPAPPPNPLPSHHADDGSAFYNTHDNVFIAAPSGAAYGGNSLKSEWEARSVGAVPAVSPPRSVAHPSSPSPPPPSLTLRRRLRRPLQLP